MDNSHETILQGLDPSHRRHIRASDGHWLWSGPRDKYGSPALYIASRQSGRAAVGMAAGPRFVEKIAGSIPGWHPVNDCGNPNCVLPAHYAMRPRAPIARRRLARSNVDSDEICTVEDALILAAYSPLTVRDLTSGLGVSELVAQTLKRERHSVSTVISLFWKTDLLGRTIPAGYGGPWYGQLGPPPISADLARLLLSFKLEDGWIAEARLNPPYWVRALAHSFEVPVLAVWRLWVELRMDHVDLAYLNKAFTSHNGWPIRLDTGRQSAEQSFRLTEKAAFVRQAYG